MEKCSPRIDCNDRFLCVGDDLVEVDSLYHVLFRYRDENNYETFEIYFENQWQEANELDFVIDGESVSSIY